MVAELSGDTGRRGEHGRRGYGERRRRAPLGREPGKGRGHGRGREGSGGCVALGGGVQSVEEGERQAGGGSARAGVRWPHASRPSGARWETVAVRWAGPLELGQVG